MSLSPPSSPIHPALPALLLAETLLAHRSNALWTNTSSTPGVGGGSSSLQVPARCCRPKHAAALLQLKRSFTFTASSNGDCLSEYNPANTTLSSWIEGTYCCHWEGVACDCVSGSVTGLDLSSRSLGINGSSLHPALFSLTSLKYLVLDGNYFYGSHLPASGFELLTRLEELSLRFCGICGSNNFSGSGLSGQVPSLQNLSRLEFLDLSNNNLEENYLTMPVCTRNIPLGDGNVLRNLHSVYMSDNSFTGAIRASIFTQPALEYLDLSCNHLSGHIEEFQNPSAVLKEIYLFNNNLSGAIPSSFSQFRAVTIINLSRNNFKGTLDLYP
ncbi:receptor-like protein 31 [Miscanthus floridulus]|uniref:receptor-like protein 31 n=1 Tax=Miscanthus floridulus TaxID=154761 RepID=UPI003457B421